MSKAILVGAFAGLAMLVCAETPNAAPRKSESFRDRPFVGGLGPAAGLRSRCQLLSLPPLGSLNNLNAVDWSSAAEAMAIGFEGANNNRTPAALRWSGSSWTDTHALSQGSFSNNVLEGVKAIPGTSGYWAVGTSYERAEYDTLIERWNGSEWSLLPTSTSGWLFSVSATGPTAALAVGSSNSEPIALRWNGKKWRAVAVPVPSGAESAGLSSVDMVAARDAWAVGGYRTFSGTNAPLVEHWDGTSFSIAPSPPVGDGSYLDAVGHADGSNQVWAAGLNESHGSQQFSALFEVYDGSQWTVVPGAPDANFVFMQSISVVSPTNAWAAGSEQANGSSLLRPLLEHWNGKRWKIVNSIDPNPEADSMFLGVAGFPGVSNVLAVGTTDDQLSSFGESCP